MKVTVTKKNQTFEADEIIKKEAKPFGKTSSHVILPKRLIGYDLIILIMAKTKQWTKGYLKKYKNEKKVDFP